jgi:hypothetical protein
MIMTKWNEKHWAVGYNTSEGFECVAIVKSDNPIFAASLCNHLNGGNDTRWVHEHDAEQIEWR